MFNFDRLDWKKMLVYEVQLHNFVLSHNTYSRNSNKPPITLSHMLKESLKVKKSRVVLIIIPKFLIFMSVSLL